MPERRRVRRGHTREPWPCCGTAADETTGRLKGGICRECENLIRIGRETLQRQAEAGHGTYVWAEQPHWWPRYYGRCYDIESETAGRLSDAMFDVVEAVTVRIEEHAWTTNPTETPPVLEGKEAAGGYDYEGRVLVSGDQQTRDRLNKLDAAIRTALASAYAAGKARGQSILRQLAAGEMSSGEFDREVSRAR